MMIRKIGLSALLIIPASLSFASSATLANNVRNAHRIVIGTLSKIERGAVAVKVTDKSGTSDILFDRAEILEPRFLKGPKGLRPVIVFKTKGVPGIRPKEGRVGIWFIRREEILMGIAPHVLRTSYALEDENKIAELIASQEGEKE